MWIGFYPTSYTRDLFYSIPVSLFISGMLARIIIDFNNPVKADESYNENPMLKFKPQENKEVRMYVVGLGK